MNNMADNPEIICANRDCRVSESGRCVEGLELSKCTFYGRAPEPIETADAVGENEGGLVLSGADTLTPERASGVLRSCEARVIAIIGPKDAGKTSLIASLYDLFQEGPVRGAEFARSETLHAFELACHDARAASRRGEPDMQRTPHGEVRFYHLRLADGPAGPGLALLMADRAGEEYRSAADAPDTSSFPEVARADTITVLVDGQRLQDTSERHNLRSEIVMMLQALVDGGVVRLGQHLVLVLTKLDVIQSSPNRERAERDFASLRERVQRLFGATFDDTKTCAVAASPKTDAVARGTGVDEILELWTTPAKPGPIILPKVDPSHRAFSRLTELAETANE
jgi:hypothetical protein